MSYSEELEDSLNDTADEDLGTVIAVLDGEGRFEEASALELCCLVYDVIPDNWSPQRLGAILQVDPLFLSSITPEIVSAVDRVLGMTLADHYTWEGIRVAPRRVPPGWREGRAAGRAMGRVIHNQGSYRTPSEPVVSRGRLRFGSTEEAAVYDALVAVQARRPQEQTIGIIPGCAFQARDRTFWPDFVITYRARAAGIEVDGPHHHGRAAADRSRDSLLEDAGLLFMERIVVEDATNPVELETFIERVLARMLAR